MKRESEVETEAGPIVPTFASTLPSGHEAASPRPSGRFPLPSPLGRFPIPHPVRPFPLWKRGLDLALTIPALVLLSPLFLLLALCVRVAIGSPIIFRQVRPGRNGRPFTLYKFRTMRDTRDAGGRLLSDAQRLTSLGTLLRASSLDELPELINVLRGDMSLVGPRPLLVEYLPLYSAEQQRRHDVRPGITGWAQVNGRNALTWREKFALDVYYVDHLSFRLDVRILVITLVRVMRRDGISHHGHATMEPFRGGGGGDDA